MSRIVLCISAIEATAANWSTGKLRAVQRFDASDDGLNAFRAWLAPYRGRQAWITVDTVDEEYRLETVPHVPARQRAEMLERKLQQLYRSSRYRAGRAVRSVRDKRREDLCLLAAYADERIITPWCDELESAGLLIAALHPVPLLLAEALQRTGAIHDPVLLLMRWSGGIRQTVVSGAIPVLTRVTSITHEARLAPIATDEIRGTREYLSALGVLPVEQTLTVHVLDSTIGLIDDPAQALFRVVPLPAALARSIVSAASEAPSGTHLQLGLLARYRCRINLAPPALRAQVRRRGIARLAIAGCLCIGLCCAIVAAVHVIDAVGTARQRSALGASIRGSAPAATAARKGDTAPAPDLDRALRQVNAEDGPAFAARRVYLAVSRALDAYPQLRLQSLRWEQRPVQPDSPVPASALVAVARTTLQAGNDPRDAARTMQAFATAIAGAPDVERARLSSTPQGYDAAGTLRGQFPTTHTDHTALEFETTVQFKSRDAQD